MSRRNPPQSRLQETTTTTKPAQKNQAPQKAQQSSKVNSDFDPTQYQKPGLNKDDVLKIKECFDIFDDDKSGFISINEMKNAIMALGIEESAEEIVNLIQDLDKDGTNNIDFKEFLDIFGFTGSLDNSDVLKDLFKQFDSSGQGLITVDDFKRINDLVGERYSEHELREMVEYADKDKDGNINWEEFEAVVTKEYPNV